MIKALWLLPALSLFGQCQVPSTCVRLEAEAPRPGTWQAPRWRAPGQRRIALALRGGAAKGLAHIGVLQRFEEEGLPVDAITGTSAGAFVAALAASGFSGSNQVRVFQEMNFSALLDDRRRSMGLTLAEEEDSNANFLNLLVTGKKSDMIPGRARTLRVQKSLYGLLGHAFLTFGEDFDRMRIPIRIVASDLRTGDPWVFRRGSLAEAVQASMTIPGLLAPPEVEGHQLVDGGLVENLPVLISRREFPDMVQVGVDIARKWDGTHVRDLVTLFNRSLDVSMRQSEERSRKAADVLVTPDTAGVDDFDFQGQVKVLVAAGRKAFDEQLAALEQQIHGPEGERIATRNPLEVVPPGSPEIQRLVEASLPPGGALRYRDLYRLLRRLHHHLPLADAWVEIPADPARPAQLHTVFQPPVSRVEIQLPAGLPEAEARLYRERVAVPGLRPGDPFSPEAMDACLAEFPLYAALPHVAYLRFKASTFDPATGLLAFRGEAVRLDGIDVAPAFWEAPFHRFFRDLEGRPLYPGDLLQRIDMARIRFGITGFRTPPDSQPGAASLRVKLLPEREMSVGLSLAPAYGTTWGSHLGLGAEVRNPMGVPIALALEGAINSRQKRAALHLDRELTWLPGLGYTAYAEFARQRYENDLVTAEGPAGVDDLVTRHQSLGFGLWGRFGGDDHGMVRLGVEERRSSFSTSAFDGSRNLERTVQASVEWDDFDFHALPREGTLLRLRGGRSFQVQGDLPAFKFGYARARHMVGLPSLPFSLDFDAEACLGWNTPLPRWYALGGADSLIGSQGASFLMPSAALFRFGAPLTSVSVFGIGVQIAPRLDWGRFAVRPGDLGRGSRIFGKGVVLRSIVQTFHVTLSFGQTERRDAGQQITRKGSEFTLLVGTRPLDLWKQR
ncbi:patatin-like phospholipase family protein [Mesoterricola silvestris]|uniref:PNPLA domain-containing protein n=1 Tax=Mesoterricola silvestris TaxID=2927979 RepID=A0AA48GLZ9_9BACT|nr:patatin-like phospholipase family protein [Mesoterricola silvestris]BDU73749.1 hypothetical protein METEAL_29230 [Mesoterricola silvestris]